ncbi:MAG: cation transporter, partial [Kiritimatiellia bacterium]
MNQEMTQDRRNELGCRAVNMGLVCNVILAALKTVVGITAHSSALLADGINSTSDAVYYVVVRVFMALARKPPDPEHPYGHSQMESIAAVV